MNPRLEELLGELDKPAAERSPEAMEELADLLTTADGDNELKRQLRQYLADEQMPPILRFKPQAPRSEDRAAFLPEDEEAAPTDFPAAPESMAMSEEEFKNFSAFLDDEPT